MENGETKTERVLEDLKMPKLEEIFTTVAIWRGVIATRTLRATPSFEIIFVINSLEASEGVGTFRRNYI